jgi:phage gpG-like protein
MSNSSKINDFFNNLENRIMKAKSEVMPILAQEAVNITLENFAKESYDNKPWEPRQDKSNKRSLLVKSGRLKRSIRIVAVRSSGFTIGSDVPYASVHNNGGSVKRYARSENFVRNRTLKGKRKGKFSKGTSSGQGFSFKSGSFLMPQRKFIGTSDVFKNRLINVAKREIVKALRG